MTRQQLVQEFRSYPKAQKSAVIRELLQIFEDDLAQEKSENGTNGSAAFKVDALSLEPRGEFDFDNIGKLLTTVEGDFHK
jgi:hypothetical protein